MARVATKRVIIHIMSICCRAKAIVSGGSRTNDWVSRKYCPNSKTWCNVVVGKSTTTGKSLRNI
jgi:hypothetical protein